MKMRSWKRWVCITSMIVCMCLLWYGINSSMPKTAISGLSGQNVAAISFVVEDGIYGENNILLQSRTDNSEQIQKILDFLRKECFYYDISGARGSSGEIMLMFIDIADKPTITWQLKKSKNGTITINVDSKMYFLERFSEKREAYLYEKLFQFASELSNEHVSSMTQHPVS